MKEYIPLIIILVIIILIFIGLQKLKRFLRRTYRKYAEISSDAQSLIEMIKENEQNIATTPKTLSVTESLYLDKIKKDFPELNLTLAKTYVSEIVTDYLRFLETGDNKELTKDCTENFVTQASSFVDGKERTNIKFHRTVINGYRKTNDEANIIFQTSCQYIMNGRMQQTRFEITYIYFLEETPENRTISLKCPNCGGPIEYTGQKICKFCGCGLVDTIKRTWKFNTIKEF